MISELNNVAIRCTAGDFKEIGLKEFVMRKLKYNYIVKESWAMGGAGFSTERGDVLGIIGANNAGKSTLLKVISGIMGPTQGRVEREGIITALLELTSGLDGDLTVKENAYLRGTMFGYTHKSVGETYRGIPAFSRLEEYEDRPFEQLFFGMRSRLTFSVASMAKPDILILDEVLSVGNGTFRKKSEARMREVIGDGATAILVSHSLQRV